VAVFVIYYRKIPFLLVYFGYNSSYHSH